MTSTESISHAFATLSGPRERLRESVIDDGHLFPLSYSATDKNSRKALDAFLQRFMQTYDILARKLMPRMLEFYSADSRPTRFRDRLDALERLELIESADQWEDINDLRNRLIHEYALDDKMRANELNAAFFFAEVLETTAARLEHHFIQSGFTDLTQIEKPE